MSSISEFIQRNYRHFNAAVLKDAADAYIAHLNRGGKMMITLAGAMSTAELGVSLAEMIRRDKVHAITCTGANMEEDLFNLVARSKYERIPNYRELNAQQEQELLLRHLNRVTDTCIPEDRIHDQPRGVVSAGITGYVGWFFPNRRRHCGRFLHLRCADAKPGRGQHARAGMGLFLPDQ